MKIHFATDHAGYELKEKLVPFVRDDLGFEVEDHGAHEYNPDDDYPDFVKAAGEAVAANPEDRAIILGGSGTGEAIVANRIPGVRAVVYYGGPLEVVMLSREHNDANTLSLGARFLEEEEAKQVVKTWLNTSFSNDERHVRRIAKIDQ